MEDSRKTMFFILNDVFRFSTHNLPKIQNTTFFCIYITNQAQNTLICPHMRHFSLEVSSELRKWFCWFDVENIQANNLRSARRLRPTPPCFWCSFALVQQNQPLVPPQYAALLAWPHCPCGKITHVHRNSQRGQCKASRSSAVRVARLQVTCYWCYGCSLLISIANWI